MEITREFLKSLDFRVFTRLDYEGFGGVDSPVPLIAYYEGLAVIIDGSVCYIYDENMDSIALCEDISLLP